MGLKLPQRGHIHIYGAYFVSQAVVTLGQYRQHPASYATGSVKFSTALWVIYGTASYTFKARICRDQAAVALQFCSIRLSTVVTYEIKMCRTNGRYVWLWDVKV
jgi:hypothetical protein